MANDWPQGYGYLPLDTVDSTLDEAARRFDGLAGPTWITARRQTKARGRRGRAWANPEGNFAGTLVLPKVADPAMAALRSFVTAVALDEAFVALTGRSEAFALKWPNDVLLNGGKVAGILLESVTRQGRLAGLSIGIGVNLAHAPAPASLEPGAVAPVSLGEATGITVTPEDFLEALAPAFARREHQFVTYGFAPIREAWLARAARIGEVVTARLPAEEITGTFRTVDEAGQLVLSTAGGDRRIAAGDVFFQG
ncbi:biotin--[acetyl-CoA-carboxylase] ligase [Maritimibacter sp. DP1N21-5]|uniref:biotin--[acetyl-CoA-carboxylase] ligase n=1 Tax=Maritimibacter sp. DP1N21-5 TaxID=2836867 RepID=UPI001C470F2C|nr:biotin--[acetyl-CoA-carboxylase] ligase [Maritimibacter sp. DP1N21-5]MBV7409466.1 biotin--[acetyl-CoA-carboxylase] ligase [Maritimibacter sp. DP1N21-5]